MLEVVALRAFEHQGRISRGQVFQVSQKHATQLAAKGLARIVGEIPPVPILAAGKVSPSLPVAQVSPPKTSKESAPGEPPRKRKRKAAAA